MCALNYNNSGLFLIFLYTDQKSSEQHPGDPILIKHGSCVQNNQVIQFQYQLMISLFLLFKFFSTIRVTWWKLLLPPFQSFDHVHQINPHRALKKWYQYFGHTQFWLFQLLNRCLSIIFLFKSVLQFCDEVFLSYMSEICIPSNSNTVGILGNHTAMPSQAVDFNSFYNFVRHIGRGEYFFCHGRGGYF